MSDDMSMHERVNALLRAMPGFGVLVFVDGQHFRAALVDKPTLDKVDATACRTCPEDAVRQLHEAHLKDARLRCDVANDHLSRLLTRIIPKEQPGPSPAGSQGEGSDA